MMPIAHKVSSASAPIAMLAPMAGVTDLGMRRVAQAFGATFVVSEMVDAAYLSAGEAASIGRLDGDGLKHNIVQIAGCDAARLADAARRAEASGADEVDINMGCPAKKVVGGLGGSALMRDLDHATALIAAVVSAVGIGVTVKMRLGWDDGSRNAPDLARRAEAEGVRRITVHGRTRCQFYKGEADWAAIRAVKDAVAIPVIANGDCTGIASARRMLEASGADGVMIGRAAVGRPWLVGEIAAALAGRPVLQPTAADRLAAALAHYQSLLSRMGVAHGVRHARKHLVAYALHAGFAPTSPQHRDLVTTDDPRCAEDLLTHIFSGAVPLENAA